MAKKICPFCAEEIQGEAIKCKHCGEWLTKNSSSGSKSNKIPKGKHCHDKQCTGILNDEHVCGTCGRVYSQVQNDLRKQRQEFPITTKNKKERSGMEQFFNFAVMFFGLLIFFTVIVKMQNTPTTTPQTKKHAATTQKKKVISPTQTKKKPAIDEKPSITSSSSQSTTSGKNSQSIGVDDELTNNLSKSKCVKSWEHNSSTFKLYLNTALCKDQEASATLLTIRYIFESNKSKFPKGIEIYDNHGE
jgi:hypothetical protein